MFVYPLTLFQSIGSTLLAALVLAVVGVCVLVQRYRERRRIKAEQERRAKERALQELREAPRREYEERRAWLKKQEVSAANRKEYKESAAYRSEAFRMLLEDYEIVLGIASGRLDLSEADALREKWVQPIWPPADAEED